MIKYLSSIFILCLATVASGELLIYGSGGRDGDELLLGTDTGFNYFEHLAARLESEDNIVSRFPDFDTEVQLSRGTNLRQRDENSFDVDLTASGHAMVRFFPSDYPAGSIVGFSFQVVTFSNLEMTSLDLDGMIDLHVNQRPILWGDNVRVYRVIETDPTQPIRQIRIEGSGVANRINFFDMHFVDAQQDPENPVPEPLTIVLILAGCGLFFIFRRPDRHNK